MDQENTKRPVETHAALDASGCKRVGSRCIASLMRDWWYGLVLLWGLVSPGIPRPRESQEERNCSSGPPRSSRWSFLVVEGASDHQDPKKDTLLKTTVHSA